MPHPRSLPTRKLPARPDLEQLRRQAKELLAAFLENDPAAAAEVNVHYHGANSGFALHDAQLVLARAYGFDSWPKLKAYVDGATVRCLVDAVRAGDVPQVRAMLNRRPELARMSADNHNVLHHAVLHRSPALVRLLMEHGADARDGVYPHRDATSPLAIATERGDDEIVAIIQEHELRRRQAKNVTPAAPEPDEVLQAIASGKNEQAIALLEARPDLIHACTSHGWTPLHAAAASLNEPLVAWLLDHGAEPMARGKDDQTPLDLATGRWWGEARAKRLPPVAKALQRKGAVMTARAAAALGDAQWLWARNAEGTLVNPIDDTGGLLRIAATHNRPAILELLLNLGFDPDEKIRCGDGDEVEFTWGMPLWYCASTAKYGMAETLLKHGADPNARVYASGDPMFQAYSQRDWKMVSLLESYGGVAYATTAGLFRQTELARKMLASEARYGLDGVGGDTLAEQLLWGAACGGDPEIVRMALDKVDWPRDDPRWFTILEQPLRIWMHGAGSKDWDRATYLECFRLVLQHCDPNIRGRPQDQGQFGLTILHSVAGSREHLTPEERVAFATMLLGAGARLDIHDNLLKSTPLGWACRWGRAELVKLFLNHGADPIEADAEPWAAPRTWAEKKHHNEIIALLRERTLAGGRSGHSEDVKREDAQ